MEVIRISSDDEKSWPLFPVFEARVKAFIAKHLPDQPSNIVNYTMQELRQRWINTPQLCGYWLVNEGEKAVAHFYGYISNYYDQPFIYIHQAECDEGHILGPASKSVMDSVELWAAISNSKLAEANKITSFELCTWRNASAWERYLGSLGYTSIQTRSVLKCKLRGM